MTNPSSAQPTHADVLTINGGSSSIKFAVYQTGKALESRFRGSVDRIGLPGTNLTFSDATGNQHSPRMLESSDPRSASHFLIDWLTEQSNAAKEDVISANAGRVAVRVMHTDEELMIARAVCRMLGLSIEKEHDHKNKI